MPVHPLADQAATLRRETLTFLRTPLGQEVWSWLMAQGHSFTMPASWSARARSHQAESLVAAESRRVADGVTFAMDSDLIQAARTVGQDQSIPLPFTADVLPAPSGMLAFSRQDPLMTIGPHPVIAATWGPPMDGFGPGTHLTWWTAMPDEAQEPDAAARGRLIPMNPDFDLHLSFLPRIDTRLLQRNEELSSGLLYSAVPLRTVVAAWYALTADTTTLSEQRPQAAVTQALKELKAKKRGVQVATAPDADTTHRDITERAAQKMSAAGAPDDWSKPSPEFAATSKKVSHGVFDPALDHQLDAGQRRIAHIYREAAAHWHRLETQANQKYPGIFANLEELRAREHKDWQPWCWVPSRLVSAYLKAKYDTPPRTALWDGARIAALGAWRNGGRHSILTTMSLQETAGDRAPVDLPTTMPAPGLGMVIDDNGTIHLLLVCLDDVSDHGPADAELLLTSNYGDPAGMLEDITKLTLFLTGDDLLDAVRTTQAYYDDAAAVNSGKRPRSATDAETAQHTYSMQLFTGLLAAICAPGADLLDAGALTGRKLPATWPPQPNILSEMTLWLLAGPPETP